MEQEMSWGYQRSTGNPVHVSKVNQPGLQLDITCLVCDGLLVVKKGPGGAGHFSHQAGAGPCEELDIEEFDRAQLKALKNFEGIRFAPPEPWEPDGFIGAKPSST